jgi:pyruvate ferredoxin oxidoreductase beta subunit
LQVLRAAVDSRFWPLYEVVNGTYRLTYTPTQVVPVEAWLQPQKRFAHLARPENRHLVEQIQACVDRDWATLVARCV